MPDPITVNEQNQWAADIAGDNDDRFQALAAHENIGAFVEAHFAGQAEDWRIPFVGEGMLSEEQAARYTSPADFGKSWAEQHNKIRSGLQAPTLDANASEDDIKSYRETNGIPLEAKGYTENLEDGLVVGENDVDIVDNVMGALHEMNAPPAIAHGILKWYNGWAEEQQNALMTADAADDRETTDNLREAWGNDYRSNVNVLAKTLESQFGSELADYIRNSRGPDGKGLMNSPEFQAAMVNIGRTIDPLTPHIPANADAAKSLNDEIDEIEKFMRTDRPAYNKDEKMQARLRELYGIRTKHDAAA